eukprot:TRINITY_DN10790_c0_g1_i1.p1 TRINITY_DN10790_c0_g1~~TRINITY_DN10790_c0_g1_i1.p1  ORF type:complete len:500 (-),score=100.09 TRINITY_DN10790_c0_g1_i1:61-1560(-)
MELDYPTYHTISKTEPIGASTYGIIYKGNSNGKEVSLKSIESDVIEDSNPSMIYLYVNTLKMMDHENLMKVTGDAWNDTMDGLYLVYDTVTMSLDRYVVENRIFERNFVALALQIAGGVEYVHMMMNLVHGDLRLDNIFLYVEHGVFTVKIGDYGVNDSATLNMMYRYTRNMVYIAPENRIQFGQERKEFNEKTDIFALGVIFMEILTAPLDSQRGNEFLEIYPELPLFGYDVSGQWIQYIKLCTNIESETRPDITSVITYLDNYEQEKEKNDIVISLLEAFENSTKTAKEKKYIETTLSQVPDLKDKLLEIHSPLSLFYLGRIYQGLSQYAHEKNLDLAYEIYKKSGHPGALYNLAWMYQNLQKDMNSATEYYKQAMDKGHVTAMVNLGNIYKESKQIELAIDCYRRAIAENNVLAMYNLGFLYDQTLSDYVKAEECYKMAVNLRYPLAMMKLGEIYEYIHKDPLAARDYYQMAANEDHRPAYRNLSRIERVINARDL